MGGVALITGAGKGIGRALAVRLAQDGWAVGLVARTAADLAETAEQVRAAGGTALELPGDVADRAAAESAVARTVAELGPIDLLVNNAARSASWSGEKFWEVDPDDWWDRLSTNLRGPVLFSRAALPGMVERGSGRIVMMNSEAGAITLAMTDGAYPVSKGALFRLTDHLGGGAGPLPRPGQDAGQCQPGHPGVGVDSDLADLRPGGPGRRRGVRRPQRSVRARHRRPRLRDRPGRRDRRRRRPHAADEGRVPRRPTRPTHLSGGGTG
jgi:NAD(P)-dependent dehydrogenase (short-subunit alcohol dehydrogenase family)